LVATIDGQPVPRNARSGSTGCPPDFVPADGVGWFFDIVDR